MNQHIKALFDFDAFFAKLEEQRRPWIRGIPVVIYHPIEPRERIVIATSSEIYVQTFGNEKIFYLDQNPELMEKVKYRVPIKIASGAIATTNYEARELGVSKGISFTEALYKLSDSRAVFIPNYRREYHEPQSSRIMKSHIFPNVTKVDFVAGVDEVFADITDQCDGDFENAKKVATSLKDLIKQKEFPVTVKIGIGVSKVVAKMACDECKPDSVRVVKPEETQSFLDPKTVEELYYVGDRLASALKEHNILKIEELRKKSELELQEIFYKIYKARMMVLSHRLHETANGRDVKGFLEPSSRKSIGRGKVLPQKDVRNLLDENYLLFQTVKGQRVNGVRNPVWEWFDLKLVEAYEELTNLKFLTRNVSVGIGLSVRNNNDRILLGSKNIYRYLLRLNPSFPNQEPEPKHSRTLNFHYDDFNKLKEVAHELLELYIPIIKAFPEKLNPGVNDE